MSSKCDLLKMRFAHNKMPDSDGGLSGEDGENPPAMSGGHDAISNLGGICSLSVTIRGDSGLQFASARCLIIKRTIGPVLRSKNDTY